jgi:hypothetical protein
VTSSALFPGFNPVKKGEEVPGTAGKAKCLADMEPPHPLVLQREGYDPQIWHYRKVGISLRGAPHTFR